MQPLLLRYRSVVGQTRIINAAFRVFATATNAPAAATQGGVEGPAKPLSRWRRLKLERKAAPTPANRTKHDYDRTLPRELPDAIKQMRAASWAQFDETIELVLNLNVDPRRAEHNLRGSASLPHGTGVPPQIVAFVPDEAAAKIARSAGVDLVGGEDLIDRIKGDGGKCVKGFSVGIAVSGISTSVAAKIGRQLGPKGLLPTTKLGTIYELDGLSDAVAELRRGKMKYRVDKFASLQLVVGKMSFTDEMLIENIVAAYRVVLDIKPQSVKKAYVTKAILSSSMGPSVKLDYRSLGALVGKKRSEEA